MTDSMLSYRTQQIRIKTGHRLFAYFEDTCQNAKNLYNTTNFYIRQIFTAASGHKPMQPLQQQVLDTLIANLDAMNERLTEKKRSRPFKVPTRTNPFISYSLLDGLFKVMGQADYRALPAQSSQGIMKVVFQNWRSFFASIRDYRKHPEKYAGRPNIPGYMRGKTKDVVFSNQDCTIKERKFLKLPYTKKRLNIGKLGCLGGKLMQVRVVPSHGQYVVELIFAYPREQQQTEQGQIMAIDLGVNNLATIVTTKGSKPMIVKGGIVKAVNQYYNKMKAHYTSILRQGKEPQEGAHTSRRLERLHLKRHLQMKDLFHKASHHIVKLAAEQGIGTIVIGHNDGWKQKLAIGRRNNQTFSHIPHRMLTQMIQYKAAEQGITVTLTEEAYTSKASFLDQDPLPPYGEEGEWRFSGKRICRGLYRSTKALIHADVNGAANIMRKVFPNATAKEANGIEGLDGKQTINVSTPLVLSIWK
ncbi:RNA-guided endonuclease InsQ/TnpB family protein [Paenibacillus sp. MCAF20]